MLETDNSLAENRSEIIDLIHKVNEIIDLIKPYLNYVNQSAENFNQNQWRLLKSRLAGHEQSPQFKRLAQISNSFRQCSEQMSIISKLYEKVLSNLTQIAGYFERISQQADFSLSDYEKICEFYDKNKNASRTRYDEFQKVIRLVRGNLNGREVNSAIDAGNHLADKIERILMKEIDAAINTQILNSANCKQSFCLPRLIN